MSHFLSDPSLEMVGWGQPVPSPEQTKGGGTSGKMGALKWTKLLHTKVNVLRLYKLCAVLKILYSCLKKETYKPGSVY